MAITKHQLSVCWLSIGKSNAKKSGNSKEKQLLNLKNIESFSKKSSYVCKDNLTDFDYLMN